MKLRDFMKNLNDLIEKDNSVLDLDVVTSKDDEGNGFNLVHYTPQIGNYDGEERHFSEAKEINAICIN